MENKTVENTEVAMSTEPTLTNVIVEVLTREVESIKELLSREDLLVKN